MTQLSCKKIKEEVILFYKFENEIKVFIPRQNNNNNNNNNNKKPMIDIAFVIECSMYVCTLKYCGRRFLVV